MNFFDRLIVAWSVMRSKYFLLITAKPTGTNFKMEMQTCAPRNPLKHTAFFTGADVLFHHSMNTKPSPIVDSDIENILKSVEGGNT